MYLVLRQQQHVTVTTVSAMRAPAIDMAMMIMVVKPMASGNQLVNSDVIMCIDTCCTCMTSTLPHVS